MVLPDVPLQATECRIVLLLCLLFLLGSTVQSCLQPINPQGCSVTGEISGNTWVLFVNTISALPDV
jgi:hypothetical protein